MPELKPLDHLALAGDDMADALVLRSEVLNFKELNCRIGMLASWLRAQGLAVGDRVACWLPKTEIACLMPLAAARAGLVNVPVNPLLKAQQVAHIISDSGARLLVANTARLASLTDDDHSNSCRKFDEKQVVVDYRLQTPMPPSVMEPNALCALMYTSGSTGRPKGVMLSHANLYLGALSVAGYLKLASDDRTLCVLPLSFDYGQNQLLSTWAASAAAIPLDYLTPRDVIKASARHRITTLAAVPPLWVQLLEQEWPEDAIVSMRRLTNSGGALTPGLVKGLRAIFTNTDIYAMYGLTEAFRSTYLDPSLIDANPRSMGSAIPFAEILVVNDQGEVAANDEEGELVHCGPLVAQGYWQDAERTAERFRPAPAFSVYGGKAVWSGDRVRRSASNHLYFIGRRDAMIKSSGNRISPQEIEDAAISTGLVSEAVAIGVPDERLGQAVVLVVRAAPLQDGDVHEALGKALKHDLPNFMVPRNIVWRSELPRNPNGKLDRNLIAGELNKEFAA